MFSFCKIILTCEIQYFTTDMIKNQDIIMQINKKPR